ncbi:MAG TPA: SO2930 family diheme c-type cytochrome [Polyangiaceae bacterium]|nr:SO2930 family diheme c-type cytochrome [Polyangiaceae bacterium]
MRWWLAPFAFALLAACGGGGAASPCAPSAAGADKGDFPSSVGAYCMVSVDGGAVTPERGVTPYDLNTPLFSDYAVKYRTVWLPKGGQVTYVPDARFEFPVGTVITKSFGFPPDFRVAGGPVNWIETRVLVRAQDGWKGTSYVWDGAHHDAKISAGGEILNLSFVDAQGRTQAPTYLVPSQAQCKKCHANDGAMISLGPWADQLNRDFAYVDGTENELARWSRLGLLAGAPPPDQAPKLPVFDDPSTGDMTARARAYLQANCSYCHNGNGEARTSGLVLLATETDPYALGVCKGPVAAGKAAAGQSYDVVPAHPEQSILVYRMQATAPMIAMPELGRSLEHVEAVQVVSDWITQMSGSCP